MILVYADESGTHDVKAIQPGSKYPIIAGFAALESVWREFRVAWDTVLTAYDVRYYHAKELRSAECAIGRDKRRSDLSKNPYFLKNWDLNRIAGFRNDLTQLVGLSDIIPIAGSVSIPLFNAHKTPQWDQDPYKMCMDHFFYVCKFETELQLGEFTCDISFVFDQNDKKQWSSAIDEVFARWKKTDRRMSGLRFEDKKDFEFFPLQAADLLAYRIRQLVEDHANDKLELTELDTAMLRNVLKSGAILYPALKPWLK